MKKSHWWLTFAKVGHAVGVGIGAGAGTVALLGGSVPVYGPIIVPAVGVLASLATLVTHYADKGIASA